LILQGRVDEARELFERLLSLRNDVGLLAEEFDPRLSRQVGNFPQAFSHVALINTAFNLTRAQGPAEQRARSGRHRRLAPADRTSDAAAVSHGSASPRGDPGNTGK
jgi:hypothetical protein